MNWLVVAATKDEIMPTIKWVENKRIRHIDCLITGVGMVATVFELTKKLLTKKYDLIINAGIAGSFNEKIEIGSVVEVCADRLYELGAEDGDDFFSAFDLNLMDKNEFPFSNGALSVKPKFPERIQKVTAITVNKVHGNVNSIKKAQELYNPDIETMEGAAVFYTAIKQGVSVCQIRSISNKVEKRNRDKWDIPLAIEQLNAELIDFLSSLNKG